MVKRVRCHCGGVAECRLCRGTGRFDYEVGERGFQPFPCPTCQGVRSLPDPDRPEGKRTCFTCDGIGTVDPASPPSDGLWEMLRKVFFGA